MLLVKLKGLELKPLKVSFTIHKRVTKLAIERGELKSKTASYGSELMTE